MKEIALISTREVIYNAPSQKLGKIKETINGISDTVKSWFNKKIE